MKKLIKIETGKSGDGIEFAKTLEGVRDQQKRVRNLQNQSLVRKSDFIAGSPSVIISPTQQEFENLIKENEKLISLLRDAYSLIPDETESDLLQGIKKAIL